MSAVGENGKIVACPLTEASCETDSTKVKNTPYRHKVTGQG
jgi:hypothetical protein